LRFVGPKFFRGFAVALWNNQNSTIQRNKEISKINWYPLQQIFYKGPFGSVISRDASKTFLFLLCPVRLPLVDATPIKMVNIDKNKSPKNKRLQQSQLFKPYRALGYVTDGVPFVLQHHGTETFVITSIGKSYHLYNVSVFIVIGILCKLLV
jgi:hypothetical protein